jgi:IclR family acetate operon transcriptional repressor
VIEKSVDSGSGLRFAPIHSERPMESAAIETNGTQFAAERSQTDSGQAGVRSVRRALSLVNAIAEAGGEAALTDLSARTGLPVSTCHHLLKTLIECGYAAQVPGKKLYVLGTRFIQLSHACVNSDLPRRAQPYLEAISEATGETVHLAALQGNAIVTVALREARHAIRVDAGGIGKLEAPHATSIGKAILAWLPENEIRRVLATGMASFTEHTITALPELIESLRQVRREGIAFDLEEFIPGVICVGAPIRDQAGAVIGAISASMPKMRATDAHMALTRAEIIAATRALSEDYGAPRGDQPTSTTIPN